MRTTIEIEDGLLSRAMIAAGETTASEAVEAGLRLLVRMSPQASPQDRPTAPPEALDRFLGSLAGKTQKVATLEEISEAAAEGWSAKR